MDPDHSQVVAPHLVSAILAPKSPICLATHAVQDLLSQCEVERRAPGSSSGHSFPEVERPSVPETVGEGQEAL